jgi:2-polyprenyl-6-methoxyphenol hydroxylase-like FAD-dependent oxidoreductase
VECNAGSSTRHPTRASISQAQVINPRSLELLQKTGVSDAVLHNAHSIHRVVFYEDWRPLAELEFGHAHPDFPMAVLPQAGTEALLSEALRTHGVVPERGTALGSFEQDDGGVNAILISSDGSESFHTPLMFAADGAHSGVREALGVTLEGSSFRES